MPIRELIESYPGIKKMLHFLLVTTGSRPRIWTRLFINPFIHQRSWNASISWHARLDVLPNHKFIIGAGSAIEDHTIISNGLGDIIIGTNTFIGYSNIIIGPAKIGNNIIFAQHVVLSGLNHGYENIHTPIKFQPCKMKEIVIEDDCWIGANVVITAGCRIGKHSVVAAGSVITRDVLPFSVVGGNPAKILKVYNEKNQQWEKPDFTK
jgi:carbonic anhydrase/acetyltransferase-like protein (isoleucine patch superfamily)